MDQYEAYVAAAEVRVVLAHAPHQIDKLGNHFSTSEAATDDDKGTKALASLRVTLYIGLL